MSEFANKYREIYRQLYDLHDMFFTADEEQIQKYLPEWVEKLKEKYANNQFALDLLTAVVEDLQRGGEDDEA